MDRESIRINAIEQVFKFETTMQSAEALLSVDELITEAKKIEAYITGAEE